jgi:hypothetical protein
MDRKTITSVLIMAAVLAMLPVVSGHDPSEMELTFNYLTQTLTITIEHDVDDGEEHFINHTFVYRNGELAHESNWTFQEGDLFVDTLQFGADDGDEIRVVATCNQGGEIEETIEADIPGGDEDTDPWAVWCFLIAVIALLIGGIVFILFWNRRRKGWMRP